MQGILAPADAVAAVTAGVDGIVISNHGVRVPSQPRTIVCPETGLPAAGHSFVSAIDTFL